MDTLIEIPTRQDQQVAKSALHSLHQVTPKDRARTRQIHIKYHGKDEFIPIPAKAFHLLVEIVESMAQGKSITIMPTETELSSQQAADLLQVSRPHLVKLLESGDIPFYKTGAHRRVKLKDIIQYKEKLKAVRERNLELLASQSQKLNLGY